MRFWHNLHSEICGHCIHYKKGKNHKLYVRDFKKYSFKCMEDPMRFVEFKDSICRYGHKKEKTLYKPVSILRRFVRDIRFG